MFRPLATLAVLTLALAASPPVASATQTIVLRTGQSGGAPGSCGNPDDSFRYFAASTCGTALSAVPFTPADFAAAQAGSPALVITPHGAWGQSLVCDADARWINPQADPFVCTGTPMSALYACPFEVTGPCSTATVDVCWLTDDHLGDILFGGANPIGVYINGAPLDSTFAGGSYSTETSASATNVTLTTGTNWLYVYQRDAGCSVSGLILQATIHVDCPVSVEPGTWGRVKSLFH